MEEEGSSRLILDWENRRLWIDIKDMFLMIFVELGLRQKNCGKELI